MRIGFDPNFRQFLEWIPFAGAVISIITQVKLGTAFGKSGGFKVGTGHLRLYGDFLSDQRRICHHFQEKNRVNSQ